MRSDWCNEHTKEIIENCNLGKSAAYELEQAVKFRKEHSGLPKLSNTALIPLARIKDPEKQAKAIEAVSQVTGPLTKKQVQAVIATIILPKEIVAEYEIVEEKPEKRKRTFEEAKLFVKATVETLIEEGFTVWQIERCIDDAKDEHKAVFDEMQRMEAFIWKAFKAGDSPQKISEYLGYYWKEKTVESVISLIQNGDARVKERAGIKT